MAAGRYFPGGHPALAEKLDCFLARLAASLGAQPFAEKAAFLLLAGGYGRGEGGIFQATESAPAQLYNDLEFYLVLRDPAAERDAARWCHDEAHRGEEEIGIEVEFKVLTLAALHGAGPSMFYYDLLAAHGFVWGDAALVAALPARLRDPALIPAHEATRLLFNRGTGLLFCQQKLADSGAGVDSAFLERNHAKVRLALADAVLALNGRYHFSCRTRHERLGEPLAHTPPDWPQLKDWHASAVDFKFHPRHENPAHETLRARQSELVATWTETFLWLESLRLRHNFRTPADYAAWPGRLFPEFPPARNFLLHLRDRLRRGTPPRGWFDYPRAPLQRTLLALLGSLPALTAAHLLALPAAATADEIHTAYRRWWSFYN